MTIENLVKVVPPPTAPADPFEGPWEPVELALGTALPSDYKAFASVYGSGYFMEFLGVEVPERPNPAAQFRHRVSELCGTFGDDEWPYPLWPSSNGLLPFGWTDDGDRLLWLPLGAPEQWRTVFWDRGFQTFEVFDCDVTDFLAGLATGTITPREFPDDLLPCDHLFQPHPT